MNGTRASRPAAARILGGWLWGVGGLTLYAGCGESLSDLQGKQSEVTSLRFTPTSSIPGNSAPAFDITVNDSAKAQLLYQATLTLPTASGGLTSCPADFGVVYHLTFGDGTSTIMQADAQPAGCEFVSIAGTSIGLWALQQPTYWSVLAQALDVTESQIYPWPGMP